MIKDLALLLLLVISGGLLLHFFTSNSPPSEMYSSPATTSTMLVYSSGSPAATTHNSFLADVLSASRFDDGNLQAFKETGSRLNVARIRRKSSVGKRIVKLRNASTSQNTESKVEHRIFSKNFPLNSQQLDIFSGVRNVFVQTNAPSFFSKIWSTRGETDSRTLYSAKDEDNKINSARFLKWQTNEPKTESEFASRASQSRKYESRAAEVNSPPVSSSRNETIAAEREETYSYEIPFFLQKLYRRHTLEHNEADINEEDVNTYGANTARVFYHQDIVQGKSILFNISGISATEVVVGSELRMIIESDNATPEAILVDLHELSTSLRWRHVSRRRLWHNGHATPCVHEISPLLRRWLEIPHSNRGLRISVRRTSANSSASHRVRLRRSLLQDATDSGDEWHRTRPFVVTYTQDSNIGRTPFQKRSPRAAKIKVRPKSSRKQCRRHREYFNFSEIGWNTWILAPHGYDPGVCRGQCSHPFPNHIPVTNHAIVQSLLSSIHKFRRKVPKPCCAATSLKPLSMVMREQGRIIHRNYDDMVISRCGCL